MCARGLPAACLRHSLSILVKIFDYSLFKRSSIPESHCQNKESKRKKKTKMRSLTRYRRCLSLFSVVLIGSSSAFSPPPTCAIASLQHSRRSCSLHLTHQSSMLLPRASLYSFFLGALFVVVPKESRAAFDADDERLLAGYATLVDLIENWGKYAGKGEEANGDNVRRQVRRMCMHF